MAKATFNQKFTIFSATGEARTTFFGNAAIAPVMPTIELSIASNNKVKMVCENFPGSCTSLGDAATVEYLGTGREDWPTNGPDLIAGYIFKGDPARQQFLMMWAVDKGPGVPDELHFYMFRHASLVSSFIGDDLFGSGGGLEGQENGGGSGNGPGKS